MKAYLKSLLPKSLLVWLVCLLVLTVIWLIVPYAYYGRATAKAVKESAESSTLDAQQGLSLMGSLTSLVGDSTHKKDGSLFKLVSDLGDVALQAKGMVTAGTGTLDSATGTLRAATGTIKQTGALVKDIQVQVPTAAAGLAESKIKADALIVAYTSLPAHLTPVADNTAELVNSLNDFASDKKTTELRDHLSDLFVSLTRFTDKGTLLEGDVHDYIKPYDGGHPKAHEAWVITQGLLGIGSKAATGAYYGIGAFKGQ